MFWTKHTVFKPPFNVPIYVWTNEEVKVKIINENNCKYFLTLDEKEELIKNLVNEKNYDKSEIEEELENYIIFNWWSFIPLMNPEEIFPKFANLNNQINSFILKFNEIKKEMESLPKFESIHRLIENLQYQISLINPDPYQQWRNKKLKGENS